MYYFSFCMLRLTYPIQNKTALTSWLHSPSHCLLRCCINILVITTLIVEAGPFLFSIVSGWPWVNPCEVTVCLWFAFAHQHDSAWFIPRHFSKEVSACRGKNVIQFLQIAFHMQMYHAPRSCYSLQVATNASPDRIWSSLLMSFDIWLNYYCTKSCDSDKLCSCEFFPFFNPILEKIVFFFLSPCYLLSIWKHSVKFCWLAIE